MSPEQLPLLIAAASVAGVLGFILNLVIAFYLIRGAVISAHRKLRTEARA